MFFSNFKNLTSYKKLILKEVSVQLIEKIVRVFVGLIVVKSLSFSSRTSKLWDFKFYRKLLFDDLWSSNFWSRYYYNKKVCKNY